MHELIATLPKPLTDFVLVTLFSLIIGLSQRRAHSDRADSLRLFGTDRTFTFIGILGYLLLISDPARQLYTLGAGVLSLFLTVFYYLKTKMQDDFGLTSVLIALLTYTLPLLFITQPLWFVLLVVVTILIFTELKESLVAFSHKVGRDEFVTLAKFLLIAGVVLPILPNEPMVTFVSITPYKVWLAVVIISSISYISYLLRKFVFKDSGIILTGILAGLYSSTAVTFVLSRQLREAKSSSLQYVAAIILATSMMFLRILILAFIFNTQMASELVIPLILLLIISAGIGFFIYLKSKKTPDNDDSELLVTNPLEFKIAIVFTVLYLAFTFITWYTLSYFGQQGLTLLSFIVGVTDIDPFLLNLFQGSYAVSNKILVAAVLQAIISNNLIKTIYAVSLSGRKHWRWFVSAFGIIVICNAIILTVLYVL